MWLVDGEVCKCLLTAVLAGPADRHAVDLVDFAQAEGDGKLALTQVAATARDLGLPSHFASLQRHAGADGARIGAFAVAFERQANPVIAVGGLVSEKSGSAAVFDENDIEQAVFTERAIRAASA